MFLTISFYSKVVLGTCYSLFSQSIYMPKNNYSKIIQQLLYLPKRLFDLNLTCLIREGLNNDVDTWDDLIISFVS